MFMSLYKVDHNSMKWYRRIFFWVLASCVVQGWILYKRHCEHLRAPRKDRPDLLSFATSVSKVLVACDSENVGESVETKKRRGRRPSGDPVEVSDEEPQQKYAKKRGVHKKSAPDEVRYDQISHWPSMVEFSKRRRCKVCQKLTQDMCTTCDLPLCINHARSSFFVFHNE